MTITDEFLLDTLRDRRVRISEAVFCAGKSPAQIVAIVEHAKAKGISLLLTRLDATRFDELAVSHRETFDYDPVSSTAFAGAPHPIVEPKRIAVVTAGTSDVPVARERSGPCGSQALTPGDHRCRGRGPLAPATPGGGDRPVSRRYRRGRHGCGAAERNRWSRPRPHHRRAHVGRLRGGRGGHTALNAILASCAPGLVTVNIDNGYGAACAAIRALGGRTQPKEDDRGET